jgi:hypothetical protein
MPSRAGYALSDAEPQGTLGGWQAIYHEIPRGAKGLEFRMTEYKRTRITVETEQVLIIRRRGCIRRWCRECAREVDMVSFTEAGALTGLPGRQLCEHARAEKWHLAADGSPLICLDSLLKSTPSPK